MEIILTHVYVSVWFDWGIMKPGDIGLSPTHTYTCVYAYNTFWLYGEEFRLLPVRLYLFQIVVSATTECGISSHN